MGGLGVLGVLLGISAVKKLYSTNDRSASWGTPALICRMVDVSV